MIKFPYKRIFGLIGDVRSGKTTVSRYLQESRNFEVLAFADQIKEEYGISIEDFEAAKFTGEIDRLRQELWDFSAAKMKNDPLYFIRPVIEKAESSDRSVVITDIRTEEEFGAMFNINAIEIPTRVYGVKLGIMDSSSVLSGTKISAEFYNKQYLFYRRIKEIVNPGRGLFDFYKQLSEYFFTEDIMDLSDRSEPDPTNFNKRNGILTDYIQQFRIIDP